MFRETDNRNGCAKRGCEKSLFCGFADNGFIRYSVIFQQAAATFFTAPFLYGKSLFIKSLLIHHIHQSIHSGSDRRVQSGGTGRKASWIWKYRDLQIAGEYSDAGKSGKSIKGRPAFQEMLDDIVNGKDDISYVLVFKLSRFGRNAADVLKSMQLLNDYDVDL